MLITFHAYWLPIIVSALSLGIPLLLIFSKEQAPFQDFFGTGMLIVGSMISSVAWLVYALIEKI